MNYGTACNARPVFDDRDGDILRERQAALDAHEGPRTGDFVIFPCGTTRRISYVWKWDADAEGPARHDVQTSAGGSFYLGDGYTSFSGSLYSSIPASTLTLTDETRDGIVWFFHHDFWGAHRGVYVMAKFRVYTCSAEAPR